jgi:hypothetical protein
MKIKKKLNEIHTDLEANVTRIYERKELITVYDLVYHSVLQFEFMGQMLTRGWCEALVVGDTRCGKTKTAERLLRHYRAGEMGAGENTSLAGLLGGMQQISKTWSIVWGKFPRNDGRLVIIDEASNLPVAVMPEFATLRSEGVARITKIQSEQTRSRTRAIWISNPRTTATGISRKISAYDYGVLTIPELIGRQADIARFDIAAVVSSGEVPEEVIFRSEIPKVDHRYTSDACHDLVMWAWSRKPSDVCILKETEQEILLQAKALSRTYHDSIPLIKLEEMPEKLARLSVALAARLFSTRSGVDLLVYPEHVVYIADVLNNLYSAPGMGYDRYSKKLFQSETLPRPKEVKKKLEEFGKDLFEGLLDYDNIRQNIIEDLTGLERDSARALISFFVRNKCLRPEHAWYRKTTPFIRLLKRIESGKESLRTREEEF